MSSRGEAKLNDALRRAGIGERQAIPLVTWYSAGAGKPERLLRVFLNPQGWQIVGDDFRLSLAQWLEKMPSAPNGAFHVNRRRVRGVDVRLPLELEAWPTGRRFEVGTNSWGEGKASIDALRADCEKAKTDGHIRRGVRRVDDDYHVTWTLGSRT